MRLGQSRVNALTALAMATLALAAGCETQRGTGTVAGAGIGALIGQAAGGNTTATLIGAGVGAGVGHTVGSAGDRREAAQQSAQREGELTAQRDTAQAQALQVQIEASRAAAERDQLLAPFQLPPSPLNGTAWQLLSVSPEPNPPVRSMVVEFRPDGALITKRVYMDGAFATDNESFRVVGDTIVINRPGRVVITQFVIDNNQLIMICDQARTVLARVGG